jgi:DnaJ-class molecular chaperone
MPNDTEVDYYEVLQISANAEPETVHRVYRLLAQRFHPDNIETGDEGKFHALSEAYQVISDPERRARYDVAHQQQRQGSGSSCRPAPTGRLRTRRSFA